MKELYLNGNKTRKFIKFVDLVKCEFRKRFPNTFKSIESILKCVENGDESYYHLVYGLVQSGKSLAISILLYLLNCNGLYTVFMTKNLSAIRMDIIHKLENGKISDIVNQCIKKIGFSKNAEKFLRPKLWQLSDTKTDNDISFENQDICDKKFIIPVLLMNHSNNECLAEFVKMVEDKRVVFIVDEYHSWFTNQKTFIETGEINPTSGLAILHWMHDFCSRTKNYFIGITATPFRVLADTLLFPDHKNIVKLKNDPPVKDFLYRGIFENGKSSKKTDICTYKCPKNSKDDKKYSYIVNIVKKIYSDKKKGIYGKQCPFVFITVETFVEKHENIRNVLLDEFKEYEEYFHIFMFNEKEEKTLDECFEDIDENVKKNGVVVIIGSKKLDTGITVKPTKRDKYIWGLTDQVVPEFKSLEYNIQLLRLCGWYPKSHVSRLWVPEKEETVYTRDILNLTNTILTEYEKDPNSILSILSNNPKMRNICGIGSNDLFKFSSKYQHRILKEKPKMSSISSNEMIVFDTKCIPAREYFVGTDFENLKICDLFKNRKKQNEVRTILENNCNLDLKAFKIGYSKSRYNEILKSVICPNTKNKASWRINGFLFGHKQENTMLVNSWVVLFDVPWYKRKKAKVAKKPNSRESHESQKSHDRKFTFKATDKHWIDYTHGQFTFKNPDKIGERHNIGNVINETYETLLTTNSENLKFNKKRKHTKNAKNSNNVNNVNKVKTKRRQNAWGLFRAVVKSLGLHASTTICSKLWNSNKNAKDEFIQLNKENVDKIQKGQEIYKKYFS